MSANTLPVVIIGAGPVGLAAALHVRSRGLVPIVLEAGPSVGTGMRQWGHVRMFSPWEYNIDKLAGALLASHGWVAPDLMRFPTGREVVEAYLEPLAATPELKPQILFDARVIAVTKERHDRMKNAQRVGTPFLVRYLDRGEEREIRARTVIDASGTIQSRILQAEPVFRRWVNSRQATVSPTASPMSTVMRERAMPASASSWSAAGIPPSTSWVIFPSYAVKRLARRFTGRCADLRCAACSAVAKTISSKSVANSGCTSPNSSPTMSSRYIPTSMSIGSIALRMA